MPKHKALQWSHSLELGIPAFDRDHRELMEILQQIHETVGEGGHPCPSDLIDRFLAATRVHFAHEEQELERLGFPGLVQHQREHGEFMRELDHVIDLCQDGSVSPRVVQLLGTWLVDHVFSHDRAYVEFLSGKVVN